MPDIHIHRDHSLGLTQARKIAWQWAEEVEHRLSMECTVIEGQFSDTVEFTRSGVSGRLIVAADHFELQAKLGFLLGAFSKTIEAEITKNLDTMLSAGTPATPNAQTSVKAPVKASAKAPAKTPVQAQPDDLPRPSAKPLSPAAPGKKAAARKPAA